MSLLDEILRDAGLTTNVYGGEGLRQQLATSTASVFGQPWADAQQPTYLPYERLANNQSFYTPGGGSGDSTQDPRIDPEALAQYLDQQGYQIGTAEGRGQTWRWLQDLAGNPVLEPQNYYTNDKAAGILGMLAIGGFGGLHAAGSGAAASGGAATGGGLGTGNGAFLGEFGSLAGASEAAGVAGGAVPAAAASPWADAAMAGFGNIPAEPAFGAWGSAGAVAAPSVLETGMAAAAPGQLLGGVGSAVTGSLGGGSSPLSGGSGASWLSNLLGGDLTKMIGSGLDIAGGMYGKNLAGQARDASDPFAPYRPGYGQRLQQIEANPQQIFNQPGWRAGLDAVSQGMGAAGYLGSGNMASALRRYGSDFYQNEVGRLAGLAGAGQTPGAGQFPAATLTGGSLGSVGYGIEELLKLARGG